MSKRSEEIWDEVVAATQEEIVVTTLRQLDALVAEYLFGWVWVVRTLEPHLGRLLIPERDLQDRTINYSDGTPCWTAATGNEKLQENYINAGLVHPYTTWAGMEAVAQFFRGKHYQIRLFYAPWNNAWAAELEPFGEENWITCYDSALPVAFCLAALASAGVQVRLELGEDQAH